MCCCGNVCVCACTCGFAYFFPEYLYQKDRKKRLKWKKGIWTIYSGLRQIDCFIFKEKKSPENESLVSKFLYCFLLFKAWCYTPYMPTVLKSHVENCSLSLEVHSSVCNSMLFHLLNKASVALLGPFQNQPHSLYDVDISSSNLENVLYQNCCIPLGRTIFLLRS